MSAWDKRGSRPLEELVGWVVALGRASRMAFTPDQFSTVKKNPPILYSALSEELRKKRSYALAKRMRPAVTRGAAAGGASAREKEDMRLRNYPDKTANGLMMERCASPYPKA